MNSRAHAAQKYLQEGSACCWTSLTQEWPKRSRTLSDKLLL
jgi:hypothetical protein